MLLLFFVLLEKSDDEVTSDLSDFGGFEILYERLRFLTLAWDLESYARKFHVMC